MGKFNYSVEFLKILFFVCIIKVGDYFDSFGVVMFGIGDVFL